MHVRRSKRSITEPMITTIIFDCFGVLCVGARRYAMSRCPAQLRPQLDNLFDQADYGHITTDEFNEQGAQLLSITKEAFHDMLRRQLHRLDEMTAFVHSLRKRYSVAMLSNANDTVIGSLFTPEELRELFDDVVVSSSIGMIKPDERLFELAATRLDRLPEECVMIDDVARNIDGAKRAGMRGVVFTDLQQCKVALQELGVHA